MKTKICSKCKTEYPATTKYFYNHKGFKYGLGCRCKNCRKKYDKPYYEENRNMVQKNVEEYREKLKGRNDNEILTPKKRKCYKCNEVKSSKEFHRCKSNKDGLSGKCKRCTIKYQEGYKKRRNSKRRIRRKTDLNYRVRCNLRRQINRVVKEQNTKKSGCTIKLVGCDVSFLRKYFEFQFLYGMTWENYGFGSKKWCIDHIRPCASFDLTRKEEQERCFNYKNLQPLWNKDNWNKSSFYKGKLIKRKR